MEAAATQATQAKELKRRSPKVLYVDATAPSPGWACGLCGRMNHDKNLCGSKLLAAYIPQMWQGGTPAGQSLLGDAPTEQSSMGGYYRLRPHCRQTIKAPGLC